jgi:small nuclear ribonucleoprotein (snRNP)-like protein
MNNSVRDYRGKIVGYEKQSNSLVEEVRKLREEIEQFKKK